MTSTINYNYIQINHYFIFTDKIHIYHFLILNENDDKHDYKQEFWWTIYYLIFSNLCL